MSEADERPRRRQARGERRISQLLQAAASVFCTMGYTASSTNAIAREAGVSPGTLYQFFPNKEAIAVELGGKLIREMEEAHGRIFTPENARLPLDRLIDAVADPFIEFNCANPAFLALIKGPDAPGRVAEEHDTLHATLLDRVSWLLALRRPSLSDVERTLIAEMSFAMFKAALDLVVQSEGEERTAYAGEMKSMLYRYLAPYVGTGPVTIGEAETSAAHAAVVAAAAERAAAADRAELSSDVGRPAATEATSRALPTSS
ncbi:TetR/AcrR family transcriptional regulator [Actinacidiphila cocklensis]|uniref:Transcriptional regulator, TetR family n=1 Tax=Actinacidiphila cocklensis TaxID=887465 RepID=A0A9W4DN95_9ACTN|nr:TetR/AcrR family transcriptional regulator [Actinacidiphila cocklensis]CAG6393265.1 Transcriptional regulator, TetR family [Actinacidiphila cocklensis]